MNSTQNKVDRIVNHTCDSGDNNKNFEIFAVIRINALVQMGRSYITLDELYQESGAVTNAQKTGIRWGVRSAKESGLIVKTETNGLYQVR